jgi:chemotaxis protein methyltransferase CheR
MNGITERADLEQFRAIVARRLGLQFDDGKLPFLGEILQRRLHARRCTGAAYLESLASGRNGREELRVLASQLTVAETYFLRNSDQFRALAEAALPGRIQAEASRQQLRLLSAGCASGEEAYSLAILLRRRFPEVLPWPPIILGLDMNPAVLAKARAARYPEWSLRETPEEIRRQCFGVRSRDFVLDESIRSMVSFEECNLAGDEARFYGPPQFDIIFCRNVIMYLVPEAAQLVASRLAAALKPGGFLFLGHAETLRGLSQEFRLRHTHDTFYYQKRDGTTAGVMAAPAAGRDESGSLPASSPADGSWVEAVRRASERIEILARDSGGSSNRTGPTPAFLSDWKRPGSRSPAELGGPLELVRQERFQEALEVLAGLPAESSADTDTQLLRAVLLTNRGDLAAAEAVCAGVLASDDLSAGAHYLMALGREHAGDMVRAVEHDRMAAYLDPAFAMPRLHLGLLAKRAGDLPAAIRELQQALILLRREDAARILLLGGGFTREALLEFSRAQLRACGGTP